MEYVFAEKSTAASISVFWSLDLGLLLCDEGLDGPVWAFTASKRRLNAAFPEETPERIISTLAPKLVRSLPTNMSTIKSLVDLRKRRINTIRNYIQDAQEARLKRSKVLQTRKVAYGKDSGHALVSLSLGVHASSLFSLCFGAHASSLHHPVEDPPSPVLTQHLLSE